MMCRVVWLEETARTTRRLRRNKSVSEIVEFHLLLVCGRKTLALYKCPIGVDGLTEDRSALQLLDGVLCIFVAFILYKGVSLSIITKFSRYLYETRSAILVHVEILYTTIFGADIQQILFLCLFMNIRYKDNPSLNSYAVKRKKNRIQGQGPLPVVSILSKRPARPSIRRFLSSPFNS